MGRMLIHPWDRPVDGEVLDVLRSQDFGQLIAPGGPGRDLPVVVPTHFVLGDPSETAREPSGPPEVGPQQSIPQQSIPLPPILLHLARPNPVWRALQERPRALLTVIADYVYVEAEWNGDGESAPTEGVPTSYYASVQLACDVEVVDDPEAKAAILRRQLGHFEPTDSARRPVDAEVEVDRRLLTGIRGLILTPTDVRAKLKFGGNQDRPHRLRVAGRLEQRGRPMDRSAAARTRARTPAGG